MLIKMYSEGLYFLRAKASGKWPLEQQRQQISDDAKLMFSEGGGQNTLNLSRLLRLSLGPDLKF